MTESEETLDLRGVPCPANAARALMALEGCEAGDLLRLLLDDGEPIENVPPSLEEQGHAVVGKSWRGGAWELSVRAGGPS